MEEEEEEDRWDKSVENSFLFLSVVLNTKKQREHIELPSDTKRALLSARIRCGREKGAWAEVPERRE